jgi:hypothetical protein
MVKRGLSKSMKKRVMELMKKKKLTVKDKKFLSKLQKGGVWYNPTTWFSSTPAAAPEGQTAEATPVSGSDDHTEIKANISSLEEKVCKVCEKTGADCGCAGGPVIGAEEENVPENSKEPISGEGEPMPQPNAQEEMNAEGQGQPKKMGGRKSRKNKRSKSRKSAKKMAW